MKLKNVAMREYEKRVDIDKTQTTVRVEVGSVKADHPKGSILIPSFAESVEQSTHGRNTEDKNGR